MMMIPDMGDNGAPNYDYMLGNQGQSKGWTLWNNLAHKSSVFGHLENSRGSVNESAWMSA